MRYAKEWEVSEHLKERERESSVSRLKDVVDRMGRWIDFRHDYKTMYPWFMESVWFIFKQLYNKGFVYRGFKVRPLLFSSEGKYAFSVSCR